MPQADVHVSLSAVNAIVFAQYALTVFDVPITSANQTSLAIGVCTFAVLGILSFFSYP
jgi:hypothetical protein